MNQDMRFWGLFGILIVAVFVLIAYVITSSTAEFESIQIIERTVFDKIELKGDTECVFDINGTKMYTLESPCMYKIGDKVETKVYREIVRIIKENKNE